MLLEGVGCVCALDGLAVDVLPMDVHPVAIMKSTVTKDAQVAIDLITIIIVLCANYAKCLCYFGKLSEGHDRGQDRSRHPCCP